MLKLEKLFYIDYFRAVEYLQHIKGVLVMDEALLEHLRRKLYRGGRSPLYPDDEQTYSNQQKALAEYLLLTHESNGRLNKQKRRQDGFKRGIGNLGKHEQRRKKPRKGFIPLR